MGKTKAFLLLMLCIGFPLFCQIRSFNDLFPSLDQDLRNRAFSSGGIVESRETITLHLTPSGEMGTGISNIIMGIHPSCIVETLMVMPYTDKPIDLLTVYNATGKIRGLKGRLYHSFSRNEHVPLFEEATRIESPKKTAAIPDPQDANTLPGSNTIYVRLKDVNFGNSYYQADIQTDRNGLLYGLSNFRNLSYGIIPVIRERKFNAQFYIEPLAEGVLVYSAAATEVSDFIANRIDIPSAIRKRLEVILGWLLDNISG